MEYRQLGGSALQVPLLTLGCAGFGGEGPLFSALGGADVTLARRLVDICLEAGVTMFDTADVYSNGGSERVLGEALKGRRDKAIVATKIGLPLGRGADQRGHSPHRLIAGVEAAIARMGCDYIDLLQLHALDAFTPPEEVLATLDQLVRDGKVRYLGVSNYPGWQLMKALALSERNGWARYVAHQAHYSLICRDYEWDLMPLGLDQGVGALVWSPLGWGRLAGKIRRGQPPPKGTRMADAAQFATPVDEDRLYQVVDVLDAIAAETGKSNAQIAIAWLLSRPTVASVIIGVRNEEQLTNNLGATGWSLSADQIRRLDEASTVMAAYPHFSYRIDRAFNRLNPPPV